MSGLTTEKRYSGKFNYNGKMLPGVITHTRTQGTIVLVLTEQFETIEEYRTVVLEEAENEQKNRIRTPRVSYITGELHNTMSVTLFNCRRFYNVGDGYVRTLKFQADFMIFDEIQEATPRYNRFTFIVENALVWGGMTQVVCKKRDQNDPSRQIYIRNNDFCKKYTWADTKVKFSTEVYYGDLMRMDRVERSEITEHLKIQLIPKRGSKSVADFIKMRDQILAMISFAIKDNVNIISQYFCTEDDYIPYETHTGQVDRDYTKFYLYTSEKQQPLIKRPSNDYNFTLDELPEKRDLGKIIGRLPPVFALYSSFYRYSQSEMPMEVRFLNVTQALETFHARFFYQNDKQKMIKSVVERFGELQDSNPLRRQLLGGLSNPKILLVCRFNDLFARGANDLFAEFYKEDISYGYRLAQTRNYYTHYPEEKESIILEGNDLFDAITILKYLLEYHVCDALGVTDAEKKIRYKLYPETKGEDFRERMRAYREKYPDEE